MPAIAPPPATAAQPTGGRSRPRLQAVDQPRGAGDAERLADHVADQDAERDGRRERAREEVAVDLDAGVRQREQRHDHVARPRVETAAAGARWGRSPTRARLGGARQLRGGLLAERRNRSVARSRSPRAAGDAYVSSPSASPTTIGSTPDSNIATQVGDAEQRRRAGRSGRRRQRSDQDRARTPPVRRAAARASTWSAVDERDHGQRDDVVDDGDGEHERAQAVGEARPDQRQHARARTRCRSTSPRPSRGRTAARR